MKDNLVNDSISRQAALDIYDDYNVAVENGELEAYRKHRERLLALPPAQPDVPDTNVGDMISRQEAIKAADSIIERDTSGNNDVVKAMTAWKVYIKAMPPAQPERWIQCTERMPDNERDVLVTVEIRPVGRKPFRRVVRAFYTDGKHTDADSAYTWYELEEPDFDDDGNIIVPEGWWESSDYSEEVSPIDDFVISWREQPKPWEEEKAEGAATP